MKKFFIVAITLFCTICAGCFQAESDLIITDDGRVIQHNKFVGNALVIRSIEEWKAQHENLHPNPIVEGDLQGYEFTVDYPDVETFADAEDALHKKFSRHNRWFFDKCDLNLTWKSAPVDLPPEAEFMAQTAFGSVVFDVTIQLPQPALNHNADKVYDDAKILKWNLAPVLIRGGEKHMDVQFKLWNKDKVTLTAAIELLILTATIFFFVKARAETSESISGDLKFKRNVFAGLSVALALVSAYLLVAA